MGMAKFTADMVSDAKRLVRGEHWRLARAVLRRRDKVHHRPWTVLTLAGQNPADEIKCIRELMPKAKIVAVDLDETAVQRAMAAGADVALRCDVTTFQRVDNVWRMREEIREHGPYDVVNLDFCGDLQSALPSIRRYSTALRSSKGVLIVTFSYGRDVAELYANEPFGDVPAPLGGRVFAAVTSSSSYMRMTSALAYMGNTMPMCSLLWEPGRNHYQANAERDGERYPKDGFWYYHSPSFERVGKDDLFVAVTAEDDVGTLYALPAERVRNFRQKLAAVKASATRKSNKTEANLEYEEFVRRWMNNWNRQVRAAQQDARVAGLWAAMRAVRRETRASRS